MMLRDSAGEGVGGRTVLVFLALCRVSHLNTSCPVFLQVISLILLIEWEHRLISLADTLI